jgi:hypothetical protein
MESLVSGFARDTTLDRWERLCCIDLLGELANTGMKSAQVSLAELAQGSEAGLSSAALRNLSASDRRGEYLELYRTKCRELVRDAFDALSYFGGGATVNDLQVILAKSQDRSAPEARLGLAAKWTLEKIEILASPECDRTLIGLLDGSKVNKDWFLWAVQVTKNRSTSGIVDALRRRLDRSERTLFETSGSDAEPHRSNITDFAMGSSSGIGDPYFDEALIAYSEAGGTLNDAERQRLQRAGYACEPKKRLEELLATVK